MRNAKIADCVANAVIAIQSGFGKGGEVMSMISEQIKKFRYFSLDNEIDMLGVRELQMLFEEAADTIEELSAKLASANMERSTAYYNDGWIPCSSGKMPENGRRCWVTYEWANGSLHVDKDYLVNGKWFETEYEAVKAWMYNDEETPEPYKPKGEK